MPIIVWDNKLTVNVTQFDDHHRQLVGYINQLHDALMQKQGKDAVGKIITSLVSYTRFHFASEEAMMKKYNYPGYLKHKALHEDLTRQVLEFQAKYAAGQLGIGVQLSQFLKDWLTGHIRGEDIKYGPFFRAAGVK
jgi:hemerythrin